MKKFLIFFILMVSLMTFVLTSLKGSTNNPAISNEKIEIYRESLVNSGYFNSEESINKAINDYVETQTKVQESKKQGMSFKDALKISIITSAIILGVLFIIYQLKNAQYNELFNSHMRSERNDRKYPLKGFVRFFFGRWF